MPSIVRSLEALTRRRDYLVAREVARQVRESDRHRMRVERMALDWVLALLSNTCTCSGDTDDPCWGCKTHGVVSARRQVSTLRGRISATAKFIAAHDATNPVLREALQILCPDREGGVV